MFKKLSILFTLICIIILTAGCTNVKKQNAVSNSSSKINVAVSFNAMREFTQAIGKDKVNIATIIPDSTEPHDFDPKPRDLVNLSNAKLFIYNGLGMENWADKVVQSLDNKDLIVVKASDGFKPIASDNKKESQYDPHIWLSLKGAQNACMNIKNGLVKADPKNKSYYKKNYNEFVDKLNTLYSEYKNKFSTVSNKNFVTGHAAFAYLCRDYNLKQNSIEDVFAEGEPSPQKLKQLINYCRENKIKTIFVEDMVSPKTSETLASEAGAKTKKIYTIESSVSGKDYLQCMKENLETIYESLK